MLNKRSVVPRHNEIDDDLARKICRDLASPGSNETGRQQKRV
jgi:hypothetical protein